MPQIIWPETLPQSPQLEGYKETRPSHLIRSSTEYGPAKVRGRGSNKPITVEATYIMTDEQVAALDTFIYDTDGLAGGVRCFNWLRPKWGHVNGTSNPIWSRSNPLDDEADENNSNNVEGNQTIPPIKRTRIYKYGASSKPKLVTEGSYVRARIVPSGDDAMYELSVVDTVGEGTSSGNYSTYQIWSVTLRLEIFPNIPPASYTTQSS